MMTFRISVSICILLFLQVSVLSAASDKLDTLIFSNGNLVNGEIKWMERNVLKMKTDYSDKDFMIEWDEIRMIRTQTYFYVYMVDGSQYYGWVRSVSDSTVNIISREGQVVTRKKTEIVRLLEINQGFGNRFEAKADIGLSLTKANNLRQLTASASAAYKAEKWNGKIYGSTLSSTQDQAEAIRRSEGGINFNLILYKDWFLVPSLSLLSNTEQNLAIRSNLNLGIGKFLVRRSFGYWGMAAGVNRNIERFSNETPGRDTWEGYLGTAADLYDLKDFEFNAKLIVYPGLTETGRWRTDFTTNVKYDLPLDFYVRLELSVNFDNQPAEDSGNIDYVSLLGFGWEW